MITEAKNTRMDIVYELTADFEILKYTSVWLFNRWCKCGYWHPWHYVQKDLTNRWKWWKDLKKLVMRSCAREADKDEEPNEAEDEDEDYQTHILEELRQDIRRLPNQQTKIKMDMSYPKVINKSSTVK